MRYAKDSLVQKSSSLWLAQIETEVAFEAVRIVATLGRQCRAMIDVDPNFEVPILTADEFEREARAAAAAALARMLDAIAERCPSNHPQHAALIQSWIASLPPGLRGPLQTSTAGA